MRKSIISRSRGGVSQESAWPLKGMTKRSRGLLHAERGGKRRKWGQRLPHRPWSSWSELVDVITIAIGSYGGSLSRGWMWLGLCFKWLLWYYVKNRVWGQGWCEKGSRACAEVRRSSSGLGEQCWWLEMPGAWSRSKGKALTRLLHVIETGFRAPPIRATHPLNLSCVTWRRE